MFEWRQEPCQFRDKTDKVSLPKVTRNQTKPLHVSLKRKHTRKNRHASGLNENGSMVVPLLNKFENVRASFFVKVHARVSVPLNQRPRQHGRRTVFNDHNQQSQTNA